MTEQSERALKMLSTALEMEQKGFSFYEKAVSQSGNTLGKDVFKMLRDDEVMHVERIKAIYSELRGGGSFSETWKNFDPGHDALTGLFREMAIKNGPDVQADAEDIKALQVGIDFEAAAVKFYQEHLALAQAASEREFIEKMILEEKDHHRALTSMQHYLNNPESWFEEAGKAGLDGA